MNDKAASAPVSRRVFLVMLAGISLVTGLNAGLVRLGVWAPVVNGRLADLHGPLMVLGFMGSLISLERAQALRNRLAYAAPILLGAGAVVLISGLFPVLGRLLLFDGTLAFVAVMVALYRRAPLPLVAAQVVGAVLACLAAALLVVVEIPALVPLLAGFIVVTIAAERAELAQLTMGPRAVPTLVAASAWLSLAAVSALLWPGTGDRLFGAGALFVALWLLRDDVGRRLIRRPRSETDDCFNTLGQTRMIDHPPHSCKHTRHETGAIETVMPDGERLTVGTEQHLLVGDEPLQPHPVDVDALDDGTTGPGVVHRRVRNRPHAGSCSGGRNLPGCGR